MLWTGPGHTQTAITITHMTSANHKPWSISAFLFVSLHIQPNSSHIEVDLSFGNAQKLFFLTVGGTLSSNAIQNKHFHNNHLISLIYPKHINCNKMCFDFKFWGFFSAVRTLFDAVQMLWVYQIVSFLVRIERQQYLIQWNGLTLEKCRSLQLYQSNQNTEAKSTFFLMIIFLCVIWLSLTSENGHGYCS